MKVLGFLILLVPSFASAQLKLSKLFSRDFPGLYFTQEKLCEARRETLLKGKELLRSVFSEGKYHFSIGDARALFNNLDCGDGLLVSEQDLEQFYRENPPLTPECTWPLADELVKSAMYSEEECQRLKTQIENTWDSEKLKDEYGKYCYVFPFDQNLASTDLFNNLIKIPDLVNAARKINALAKAGDTFVFLGRSPSYLMTTLKDLLEMQGIKSSYNMVHVNQSGKPDYNLLSLKDYGVRYNDREVWDNLVTPERYKVYQEYLNSLGLKPGSLKGRLFLVDFAASGNGLLSAAILLQRHVGADPEKVFGLSMGDMNPIYYRGIEDGLHVYDFSIQDNHLTVYILGIKDPVKYGNIKESHQYGFHFPPYKWIETCKKIVEEAEPPLFSRMVRKQLGTLIYNNAKNITEESPIITPYRLARDLISKLPFIDDKYHEYLLVRIKENPGEIIPEEEFNNFVSNFMKRITRSIHNQTDLEIRYWNYQDFDGIYEMDIRGNSLGDKGVASLKELRERVADKNKVKVLKIGSNALSDKSLDVVLSWILDPGKLEYLSLARFEDKYDDSFSYGKVKEVLKVYFDSLQKPTHLKQFDISLRLPSNRLVNISVKDNMCTLSPQGANDLGEEDAEFLRTNVLPEGFCQGKTI